MPITAQQLIATAPYILVPIADAPGEFWTVFRDGSRARGWIPSTAATEHAVAA